MSSIIRVGPPPRTDLTVSVDGTPVTTLNIDSTPVTAADVGALPATGGTVTGDVTVQATGGTKAQRILTSGTGINVDAAAENLVLRTFTTAGFGGTERAYIRLSKDAHIMQLAGEVEFKDVVNGVTVHDIDPVTGVAAVGAKNGLTNLRFCGFKNTSGAPTTGTWAVGDLILDATKTWRLCSVAGTPGTWI